MSDDVEIIDQEGNTMRQQYLVEMQGEVREVYAVEADSPEDAAERWMDGYLFVSESMGTEVFSVTVDPDWDQ